MGWTMRISEVDRQRILSAGDGGVRDVSTALWGFETDHESNVKLPEQWCVEMYFLYHHTRWRKKAWHVIERHGIEGPLFWRRAAFSYVSHSQFLAELVRRYTRRLQAAPDGCSFSASTPLQLACCGCEEYVATKIVWAREQQVFGYKVHSSTRAAMTRDWPYREVRDRLIAYVDGILLFPRPEQRSAFEKLAEQVNDVRLWRGLAPADAFCERVNRPKKPTDPKRVNE